MASERSGVIFAFELGSEAKMLTPDFSAAKSFQLRQKQMQPEIGVNVDKFSSMISLISF